ncbi:MAG: alpha/beta fold hydrolase, partial [Deferrisomatales bacterium]
FSEFLMSLGAVPTDWPDLLPFLAAEVLRGRKVVIFPEGGMVKDRRVLDPQGRFSIYSRTARERRKHHTGAAVVALAVEGVKAAVREALAAGRTDRAEAWARELRLDPDHLAAEAQRPTVIVPASITFYPIRISQNLLKRGAELFSKGLSPRLAEELLIEGNILLADTDMDIRLGEGLRPEGLWRGWERWLHRRMVRGAGALHEFFDASPGEAPWARRLWSWTAGRRVLGLRDAYMAAMYAGVTVNLSHLASQTIYRYLDQGVTEVAAERFHRTLYLAVKGLQGEEGVHLHRSLRNPESYGGLPGGACPALDLLVQTASASKLVEAEAGLYRLLPKLRQEHEFDRIRIENPLAVYANEVAPIPGVARAVDGALEQEAELRPETLGALRFDDELRAFRWDREAFRKPRHEAENRDEPATLSAEPFLFTPEEPRRLGVLLVHGFTASPAEVRPFGERLRDLGHPTLGIRLKGHGTSPWDLLERSWEDWLASVHRGFGILRALTDRVAVVGFSAGGALGLRLAAEAPEGLAGVASVAAPVKVRDKGLGFVPLVHGANRLVETLSSAKGVMLFHHSEPEHPQINYRHLPIRALYELGQLIEAMEKTLPRVRCPVLLVQGSEDPTVDPKSGEIIYRKLAVAEKALVAIPSSRHGILYENVGGTQERILDFLDDLPG